MRARRGGAGALLVLLAAASAALPATAGADDPLLRHQWHLRAIQAPAAWSISRGAGVTVAVLDTGVAYEDRGPYRRAPELAGARLVAGWDFVDDDAHPDDEPPADGRRSHGTEIATIIAATAGNGIGGAGVAPLAAIMPIRVLRADLAGSPQAIAAGLRFAADHGADVANLSIAGSRPSRRVTAAITYAAARGVTIVAAAGNDGASAVSWPAADPRVLAVGAVDRELRRARYANFGADLDVVAPGGAGAGYDGGYGPSDGVMSQTLKGGRAAFCFCFMASTSAAAAQVSGVAALLLSARRAASPSAVRARLRSTARDLGPAGTDPQYGAGLVQARAALAPAGAPARPRGDGSSRPGWGTLALAAAAIAALSALLVAVRRRRAAGP